MESQTNENTGPGLVIKIYDHLTEDSRQIRQQVFVDEQGFTDEFDETDSTCLYVLAYDGDRAVANARTYYSDEKASWIIGRVAVLPEYRGGGTGALIMRATEDAIRAQGGNSIWLSAQKPVIEFYEKLGYQGSGEFHMDQHCPHLWMHKIL